MRPFELAALFVLGLAAASPARAAPTDPAVAHGAQLAQRCAACHAVGAEGASRNNGAPAFRTLRLRYNPLGLQQALKRISRFGHYEMKPASLSETDMADIAAYIDTLAPPRK